MTAPPNPPTPKPDFSVTQIVARVEADIEAKENKTPRSRWIEDMLAVAGILQALVYGGLESLAASGWRVGECAADTGFPWVTIAILALCVAPKTLGRATAGRIWSGLAERVKP